MSNCAIRWLLTATALFAVVSCAGNPDYTSKPSLSSEAQNHTLSVLYAGSMTKVMEQFVRPDVLKHSDIKLAGEGAGSLALAHMITSGLRNPDVFISASPSINETQLMGPTHKDLADWYVPLAKDEMVIAYAPKSKFAQAFQSANSTSHPWYKILEQPGLLLGRTDPRLDPKGVNTIFVMKLAAVYYHNPALYEDVVGTASNPNLVFPEETLLSRLSTGQLDAVFAYKHEAVEWGFPYVSLPPQVNLGDSKFAGLYATVNYTGQDGKSQRGAPTVFTITVLRRGLNKPAAVDFVKYMLTGHGHQLLLSQGFGATPPVFAGNNALLPEQLRDVVHTTVSNSTVPNAGGTA